MADFIHIMRQILTDIILGEHIREKKIHIIAIGTVPRCLIGSNLKTCMPNVMFWVKIKY